MATQRQQLAQTRAAVPVLSFVTMREPPPIHSAPHKQEKHAVGFVFHSLSLSLSLVWVDS